MNQDFVPIPKANNEITEEAPRLTNHSKVLPVRMMIITTAKMSGYFASTPGASIDMYFLQKFSMCLPMISSKVALQALATLEVPARGQKGWRSPFMAGTCFKKGSPGMAFCHRGPQSNLGCALLVLGAALPLQIQATAFTHGICFDGNTHKWWVSDFYTVDKIKKILIVVWLPSRSWLCLKIQPWLSFFLCPQHPELPPKLGISASREVWVSSHTSWNPWLPQPGDYSPGLTGATWPPAVWHWSTRACTTALTQLWQLCTPATCRSAPTSSARVSGWDEDSDIIYRFSECNSAYCMTLVINPASSTTPACSKCLDCLLQNHSLLLFPRAPNHVQLAGVRTEPGVTGWPSPGCCLGEKSNFRKLK